MIDGQAVKKIVLTFRAAIHLVVETVESSRTGRAILGGIRETARSVGKVLHQLWLEVTGFTFLAMAAVGAHRRSSRVWQVPVRPRHRTGTIAAGRMLHGFFRMVWAEFILACEAKGKEPIANGK